jgi:hypothetical protein
LKRAPNKGNDLFRPLTIAQGGVGMGCKESLGKAIPCGSIDLQSKHGPARFYQSRTVRFGGALSILRGERGGRIGWQENSEFLVDFRRGEVY